jgi:hypothetical protein
MATSSMSNNASSLHGRDDHAPLFGLTRGSAFVSPKVGIRLRGYGVKIGAPPPSDFCGEAASASEKRRLRRLKLGTPTARRPYLFLQGAAAPRRGNALLKLNA